MLPLPLVRRVAMLFCVHGPLYSGCASSAFATRRPPRRPNRRVFRVDVVDKLGVNSSQSSGLTSFGSGITGRSSQSSGLDAAGSLIVFGGRKSPILDGAGDTRSRRS